MMLKCKFDENCNVLYSIASLFQFYLLFILGSFEIEKNNNLPSQTNRHESSDEESDSLLRNMSTNQHLTRSLDCQRMLLKFKYGENF